MTEEEAKVDESEKDTKGTRVPEKCGQVPISEHC